MAFQVKMSDDDECWRARVDYSGQGSSPRPTLIPGQCSWRSWPCAAARPATASRAGPGNIAACTARADAGTIGPSARNRRPRFHVGPSLRSSRASDAPCAHRRRSSAARARSTAHDRVEQRRDEWGGHGPATRDPRPLLEPMRVFQTGSVRPPRRQPPAAVSRPRRVCPMRACSIPRRPPFAPAGPRKPVS